MSWHIITLDIDTHSPLRLWQALRVLEKYCAVEQSYWQNLRIRLSRRKGFHIHFYLWDEKFTKMREFLIRYYAGDDPRRMALDFTRKGCPRNILFTDYRNTLWEGKAWRNQKCKTQ